MNWTNILKSSRKHQLPLLETERFLNQLERERVRADRTSRCFSLLVFYLPPGWKGNGEGFRDLVNRAKSRMRLTDEIGWCGEGQVGVLLPETGSEGARMFLEALHSMSPGRMNHPCQVLTYPADGRGRVSGRGEDRRKETTREEEKTKGVLEPQRRAMAEILEKPVPVWKRTLDLLGSGLGLLLLSPLFSLVALYIKAVSPGPVFFKQERVGRSGRPFVMWKFRTMHINCDNSRHKEHLADLIRGGEKVLVKLDDGEDRRLIPLARVLRKSCVDELPQLINVFLGEMSLIGPRPCLAYEAREFASWQKQRFDALPGMTGLWQVSGKNKTTFKQMMRLDIRYSRGVRADRDILILLKTPQAVLAQAWDVARKRTLGLVQGVTTRIP